MSPTLRYKNLNQNELYLISSDGTVWSMRRKCFLKPQLRNGYLFVRVNGTAYDVHRLMGEHFLQKPETNNLVIDHINGNKHDNRLVNLRWATRSQNCHNSKLSVANTSGCKGVYQYGNNLWQYRICIENRIFREGGFKTKEDCKAARIDFAKCVLEGYLSPIPSNQD